MSPPFDSNPFLYFWYDDNSQGLAKWTAMFFVDPTTLRVVYRAFATRDDNIMDPHDPLSFDTYQVRQFFYTVD